MNPFELGEWMPIEDEAYREYEFPGGGVYRIDRPIKVIVKRKPDGDSEQERRGQCLEMLDGFRTPDHDRYVGNPEYEKADDLAGAAETICLGRAANLSRFSNSDLTAKSR